ncbi:Putative type IIA topoisomerase, A subunit [Herminiimonas arsenicoxydans]|uniref:Type IIA topoisomerase, A subunit n=1 Tax=Herminiimonas arsenicoxydans TaxID=204773 RepID=A4GA09_HERAR|nr:Putative type IIA topoisomerase, A subunit [Herminiimonas arsenicoxydans]
MAKRDPNKTARNRMIGTLKEKLRELLPKVLADSGFENEQSLNAKIGSRNDDFFDLQNDVINSQEQFVSKWLEGLKESALNDGVVSDLSLWKKIKAKKSLKEYTILFLKRSYLKHFEELSKNRPPIESAELWIGQQNANYGLLVTPRFKDGKWENDKSEIRAFSNAYWTIGHVMKTGLVIPGKEKIFKFNDIEQYLLFFQDTLVRNSGSNHEYEIAGHYCDYVRASDTPELIPLLIPEFRYAGLATKHVYRLDFLIINPYTLDKVGFELSPWSTHGYLGKLQGLTQKAINEMAADNFAKEIRKHRAYFKQHEVFCLIYTDDDLKNPKKLFKEEILPFLQTEKPQNQLSFQILDEFFED